MKRFNVLLLCVLLLGSVTVMAQPGHGKGREAKGDHHARMIEKLDLTEDQQSNLEELRLSHMDTRQDLQNELDIRQAELKAAVSADNPDKKEIDVLVTDINSLRGQLFSLQVYHRLDVREMLDEDQRIIFDQMNERRGKGHHGHGGKGHRGPN